jgi:hypothetical protein
MTAANSVPAVKLGVELSVSAIGFGAMALTPVYGDVDDTESLATLHRVFSTTVSAAPRIPASSPRRDPSRLRVRADEGRASL